MSERMTKAPARATLGLDANDLGRDPTMMEARVVYTTAGMMMTVEGTGIRNAGCGADVEEGSGADAVVGRSGVRLSSSATALNAML